MGCNTTIVLPDNVRVRDVANVIGILVGNKTIKRSLSTNSYFTHVYGVSVLSYSNSSMLAECALIVIKGPFSKQTYKFRERGYDLDVMYHFESELGGRLLNPRATTFWIAIGIGLVDFFGGLVDFNDSDDIDIDYIKEWNPRNINSPSDGEEWKRFQNKLLNLKPLSVSDYKKAKKFAVYA